MEDLPLENIPDNLSDSQSFCWFCNNSHGVGENKIGQCQYCDTEIDRTPYIPVMDEIDKINAQLDIEANYKTEEEVREMPDINDLKNNLRNEDLQQGDIITFVNEGEIKDVDFSKAQDGSAVKTVLQILVELPNGKNKIYTPNATTRQVLKEKWGKDTENWVNKKAKVTFVKQLAFGKQIDVLVLEPLE